jgi:hypothetical protein
MNYLCSLNSGVNASVAPVLNHITTADSSLIMLQDKPSHVDIPENR